jgi:hypothetical protein
VPSAAASAGLAGAYEQARAAALGSPPGGGHGAAVIRSRGVAAWIQVSAALPAARQPPPAPVPGTPAAAPPVVSVLAAMTLAALAAR